MERIFIEMNNVVSRCDDKFPAEALVLTESPRHPWIPFDDELADHLMTYPEKERRVYVKAVNEVLRGIKLRQRIQNMLPKWNEKTPLQLLRELNIEQATTLPRVSLKAAERTLTLVR